MSETKEPPTEEPEAQKPPIEEAEAQSPPSSPFVQRVPGILALCVAFAALAYFFFLHQYRPAAGGQGLRAALGQMFDTGLLATYAHVFNPADYHYEGQLDWSALGIAAGAALALIVVGLLALYALDLYIPWAARLALAYVVGLGSVGVVLEVETIFGLHRRESILGSMIGLAVLFAAVTIYRTSQPVIGGMQSNWGALRGEVTREYARRYRESLWHPLGLIPKTAYAVLFLLIAIVTLLTFYHGAFCPVTYWDSQILYVGYAREMFFEKAFPFKAVAQVGVGLGANYPHLYALMTAATATVAGRWSDSFAQVAPPLAVLLSCILVYHTALRLTGHRLISLALTALFRAIPYGIAYSIYASDYAFVMLFVAAFLYIAVLYLETNLTGYLILATLIPAFAMHINYLMGILWVVWAAMILLAHLRPYREPEEEVPDYLEDTPVVRDPVALQTAHPKPPTLPRLLASGQFWGWVIAAVLIASPWYVRNWVRTGNPVYAFFPSLFPTETLHYNEEVMDSATVEWTLNGDGIGNAALTRERSPKFWKAYDDFRLAADVSDMKIARVETSLARKLAASWHFWVSDYDRRARRGPDSNERGRYVNVTWKIAFLCIAIALPGLVLFVGGCSNPRNLDLTDREGMARRRFGWLCALSLLLFLAYHYLLASFYFYQVIALAVLIPLIGVYFAGQLRGKIERGVFVGLAIWTLLFPAIPYSLMGFKMLGEVDFGGRKYAPTELVALHNVGQDPNRFYKLAFGNDAEAWAALNTYGLDQKVLTHENRHLVIDRRVKLVHFDDWEVQQLWDKSPDEQLKGLAEMDVTYYLFVPNEIRHQVNRRLGPPASRDLQPGEHDIWDFSALRGWIESGVLEYMVGAGDNRLYRFKYPE